MFTRQHDGDAVFPFSFFLFNWVHLAIGQMDPAPTHCMQSVAGTISLP